MGALKRQYHNYYHTQFPTLALSKSGIRVEVHNFLSAGLQAPLLYLLFSLHLYHMICKKSIKNPKTQGFEVFILLFMFIKKFKDIISLNTRKQVFSFIR